MAIVQLWAEMTNAVPGLAPAGRRGRDLCLRGADSLPPSDGVTCVHQRSAEPTFGAPSKKSGSSVVVASGPSDHVSGTTCSL
jgi:hypothetical protein